MVEKAHILAEIKRTAAENGGRALGRQRFANETGIRGTDWLGKFWTKWGDALAEAGFERNEFQQAYSDEQLLEKLAALVVELGRFPVVAELRMQARKEQGFPTHGVWRRLGPKADRIRKLMLYCAERAEFNAVVEICREALPPEPPVHGSSEDVSTASTIGYVYLLKFRSDYKIGASGDPDRRYGEMATQMPEPLIKVHTIKTDDPFGVENYWHRRFESKRLKGEWFRLSPADVRVFKRWRSIF